ncbi:heavy metal translocating P-type ATPase [Pseudothauera rhizosphaerae]|uniref:Heavy metal translocating P-type ATPase n=1 Tax=Pseudothauera rhizosphaerae TaxID=2565932 RepID=A0A4V3WB04_9RHOO|nr:heavy metal translocating P-type ATPase [Pseudothauera rhizosphaerae]THF61371.1 heavy metal translocating P-type ATPase [Pseudothauera rhizosphaerae]
MNAPAACSHCHLPVGRQGLTREVGGEAHAFCCYGCCLAHQLHHGEREEPEAAAFLVRLGVGAFLAMFIMLFSLLDYSGGLDGAEPALVRLIGWLGALLATPLLLILGQPFAAGAWAALRDRRLGADALVVIGAAAAYGYSLWQLLGGGGALYFDTAAMVLMLFTLGRYLEAQGRVRAARSLAPMLAAGRAPVRVLGADGIERLHPAGEVRIGELLRVLPGERIGVDGVVVEGRSACEESVLTGQFLPCAKGPGAPVRAGSVNGHGLLVVRATADGAATQWARSGRLVREALAQKSVLGEAADRAAALFIPLVLLLAAATAWYWGARAGADAALLAGLAVLVVACPCALGLAAPLATVLGIAEAAQRGILVRGGAVLERLARLRGIAFDKTGTLTGGAARVQLLRTDGSPLRPLLRRAAALGAASDHPLARAVLACAGARVRRPPAAAAVRAHPGAGVSGVVDGVRCALGSRAFMARLGWELPAALAGAPLPRDGAVVYLGWHGRVRAVAAFADEPLAGAAQVVDALRRQGIACRLLSGDGEAAVARAARALGVEGWQAALLPAGKVAALRAWRARTGPVAMVGDGLNDGPVLAAADVGVAVGGAADLARESADLVLPRDGLAWLPWTLALARAVRRSVRANLAWAFGYNAVALALAAAGLLQPVLAAALMAGSSVLVVARSLRAQRRVAVDGVPGPRPAQAPVPLRAEAAR